jgi:aspartyl-tRNA(Asn)/glutamyl-tRNA(Gln) amidotransferase subunit A
MAAAWLPIADLAAKVQAGELKAVDLVEKSLKAIADNKDYNAIIDTTAERARQRAKEVDEKVAKGEKAGRLAGVPFIAKDNFLVFGAETTAASNILRGFNAPYQATAINKLEAEGAICVAKANLDAFAHGSSTENSDFFTTKNPHDKARVPGGSSGGSVTAVVLGMAPMATGTDTGGSIRQPASFTGCVGYKPTYGLVSRSGVVAMASSTDVIGCLTMSVNDAALTMDVMAGQDELDSTTFKSDASFSGSAADLKGKKVGLIKEHINSEGLDPDVKKLTEAAVGKLKQAGAEIVDISLPSIGLALAAYYIICPAEVSSNLSRYDGVKYGYSDKTAKDLDTHYSRSRGKGFGKEAKRRIMIGTYVLSSGYYDAYYKQAQTVRTKMIKEFEAAFEQVDFLVGPVGPSTAFKIGENTKDPLQMYLADYMTAAPNLVGNPAISVPAGLSNGMPAGLQIMAGMRQDKELLAFSKSAEEVLA